VKTEILYGIHPVSEALKAGRREIFTLYVAKENISKRLEKVLALAESLKIPIETTNSVNLKKLSGTAQNQGIGAKVGPYPLVKFSELLNGIQDAKSNPCILLLDNIMDPHNLGALIRTAVCIDTEAVIIPKDRSARPTPVVSKASAGALEHIRLVRVTNMVNTIKALKNSGVWVAGMDRASDKSVFSNDWTAPVAIVVGGEESGIRPLVKKQCDFLISIPQTGPLDSLNASVAGAVVMYEVFRQRRYSL
jgi:23S rRNA (guanosine2251-2'-O)-methyltransferase